MPEKDNGGIKRQKERLDILRVGRRRDAPRDALKRGEWEKRRTGRVASEAPPFSQKIDIRRASLSIWGGAKRKGLRTITCQDLLEGREEACEENYAASRCPYQKTLPALANEAFGTHRAGGRKVSQHEPSVGGQWKRGKGDEKYNNLQANLTYAL